MNIACFLLGLGTFGVALIALALVGWPTYRLFEGRWPEWPDDLFICIVAGLVPAVCVPAFIMAMYILGCSIRSQL